MVDTHTEAGALGTWTAAQCPFAIEYSRRALEEIRLAVVDAFFSVPRGGLEIGGVLLGKFEAGRLSILDHRPLECEHALGPSFTLSAKDQSRLVEALAAANKNASNLQPVGWYHSHTRSEIFLSEADLEIHSRYFPETWQVALVLRPATFKPTHGGFFFREPDGTIHATDTYQEFVIDPLPVRAAHPAPSAAPPPPTPPVLIENPPAPEEPIEEPTDLVAVPEARTELPAQIEPEAGTEPVPEPHEIPAFLQVKPARSRRTLWVGALLVLVAAGGVAAYQERELWLPQVLAATTRDASSQPSATAAAPVPITLTITGNQGPVQIAWDPHSAAVNKAESAVLQITDAGQSTEIPLDPRHLQAGVFTYLRRGDRVDAKLTIVEPSGQHAQAGASFFGALPAPPQTAESEPEPDSETATLRQQNAELRKQTAKLKSDLAAATARIQELQRQQLLLLEQPR